VERIQIIINTKATQALAIINELATISLVPKHTHPRAARKDIILEK
jgi:hypothetical protein